MMCFFNATVFLFNDPSGLFEFNTTLILSTNLGDDLPNFTPIDQGCNLNMTASSTIFFNTFNSAPKVDVCTNVCLFDDNIVGVELTTEKSPVIDLLVTLSCSWSESTKMSRYNSSNKGSGNISSISS